ncbi:hypothetical protein AHAS_Ahas13G0368900 [Arachis hypogaea]
MGKNKLIPSDFDDDHIFYLYVDLVAVTHELPSLFYRKYNHLLHDRMIVIDANDNQIELSLGRGFSAGSDPGTAIQGAQPLTCLKLLTSTQVQSSAVVIPLRFAESAFPSRHNHVNVILDNGSCYRMGLRWSKKRKVQLYLTRGWKTFAKYNRFRAGTVLEFSVLPSDETTLHVKILKI